MIANCQKVSVHCLCVCSMGWFLTSDAMAGELQAATDSLKACVESHMPDERKNQNPNVEKLLQACESELNAVLELMPGNARNDIKSQIRGETDDKLKNGDG